MASDKVAEDIFISCIAPIIDRFDTDPKVVVELYENIAKICIARANAIRVINGVIPYDETVS